MDDKVLTTFDSDAEIATNHIVRAGHTVALDPGAAKDVRLAGWGRDPTPQELAAFEVAPDPAPAK